MVIVFAKDPSIVEPSLLVNAHYDSVPFSPGASDNGVMVAMALECLRIALIQPYDLPVIFLFNDGEEAGLLGADAFVKNNVIISFFNQFYFDVY